MQSIENKIKEIEKKINVKIQIMNDNFTSWNAAHIERTSKIDGMIDILSMLTGKDYEITKEGLKEV